MNKLTLAAKYSQLLALLIWQRFPLCLFPSVGDCVFTSWPPSHRSRAAHQPLCCSSGFKEDIWLKKSLRLFVFHLRGSFPACLAQILVFQAPCQNRNCPSRVNQWGEDGYKLTSTRPRGMSRLVACVCFCTCSVKGHCQWRRARIFSMANAPLWLLDIKDQWKYQQRRNAVSCIRVKCRDGERLRRQKFSTHF